jgi:hypothetical protein
MSEDKTASPVQGGFQPRSEDKTAAPVQEGFQPRKDGLERRGYQVSQPVDLKNLQIPPNLGTAAVTPQPSGQQIPAPAGNDAD